MFRWSALKGKPLDTLFEYVSGKTLTCREANEFIVEDRVINLAFILWAKSHFTIVYIPDAKFWTDLRFEILMKMPFWTDVPPTMPLLMKQRRRWMNGGFAIVYSTLTNSLQLAFCKRRNQPWYRPFCMLFLIINYTSQYVFVFLSIGVASG